MSTEETPNKINRVRTSDAEREHVAEALRNAVTEGRLSLEEGDERLAALYQTKFRDELPSLLADLPQGNAWAAGSSTGAGPTSPRSDGRGRRGRGWSRGPGGPGGVGPGGFGSGGFGSGGPGAGGPGSWGGDQSGAGNQGGWGPSGWGSPGGPFGPGGPFAGGPAPDPRMWRRRHLFRGIRFAVIVAALITFTVITGHFFWPIIPLFFLFQFIRIGAWRRRAMRAGGWGGPGCGGQRGYGQGYGHGYGPESGQGYGPGYGQGYQDDAEYGNRNTGAAA